MAKKTPAATNGRGMETLPGNFRAPLTPLAMQAQRLVILHHVRPEWAAMLAAISFGGQQHG